MEHLSDTKKEDLIRENQIKKITCQRCGNVPVIELISLDPIKFLLFCFYCCHEKVYNWSDYNDIDSKENSPKDDSHTTDRDAYYCLDSNVHFPETKLSFHKGHNVVKLSTVVNFSEIKSSLSSAESYLIDYYSKFKEEHIPKKDKELNYLYNKNKKNNLRLLLFSKGLLKNCEESCYYSLINLLNYTQFTLEHFKEKEKVVDFLMENYIIKLGPLKKTIQAPATLRDYTPLKHNLSKVQILKEITLHTDYVLSLCLLEDNRIASCSSDKTIKVHNLETGKMDLEIAEHSGVVCYITLVNDNLVSCSGDKTIKIWSIKRLLYSCLGTLKGHNELVNKVIPITDDRLCSCSLDKTIKIWSGSPPYSLLKTLEGHSDWVNSVIELRSKKYFVSGSIDGTIRFWNEKTLETEHIIEDICFCSRNSFSEMKNNRLIIGGIKITSVINTITYQVETKVKNEKLIDVHVCFSFPDDTVFLGCFDGILFHVDGTLFKCLQRNQKIHQEDITCIIQIDKETFGSCSYDKSIKIWKCVNE